MIYESRKTWPGRTGLGRSGLLGGAFDSAGRAGMIRKPFGRKRSKVFFPPLVAVVFVSRLEEQIVGTFLCLFSPNFEIKRAFTVTTTPGQTTSRVVVVDGLGCRVAHALSNECDRDQERGDCRSSPCVCVWFSREENIRFATAVLGRKGRTFGAERWEDEKNMRILMSDRR